MIGLRGRTESARPFHLVQEIRQAAERKYRDKEKSLQAKLEDVRSKLENLQRRRGTEGDMVLNPDDKAAKLYIDRSEQLKANPPKGEWDGVWVMTTK